MIMRIPVVLSVIPARPAHPWNVAETPPTGDDPLDALLGRLAAAYEDAWLLKFRLGRDALLVGAGRRAPTDAEKPESGDLAAGLPLVPG
ncbi:hypothetical protein ACIQMV_19935 [Streptomyces sp. NPDC091412]|uniref:hypothetical protein n=1 Tax=Streptomyces sp. NPDC091412 TaxID=3366002 RepID=UPI00380FCF93